MKRTPLFKSVIFYVTILFIATLLISGVPANAQPKSKFANRIISYVDVTLSNSEKYVLMVSGKPFYPVAVQLRIDYLLYKNKFTLAEVEPVIAKIASDGFNTVAIPIQWWEIEPNKDHFNWKILDACLFWMNRYNIKLEILWFGSNVNGFTEWVGTINDPVHMRVPDYVMHTATPKELSRNYPLAPVDPAASPITSEFFIRRDIYEYTLDLEDPRLQSRETYVVGKMMQHIADWDIANGSKHPVIGVQINNESRGMYDRHFPVTSLVSYMSGVASAVKKSNYVVWTRMNCLDIETRSRLEVNNLMKATAGSYIDFVGADLYKYSATDHRNYIPYTRNNYRMIMETEPGNRGVYNNLAALSGNTSTSYYDFNAMYRFDRTGQFTARDVNIPAIRTLNKLYRSDPTDIARKSNGYGLFVHNWDGTSTVMTVGVEGIGFIPATEGSQAISINRSDTEIVLMTTGGGTFYYPQSLDVKAATKGYCDHNNQWVSTGDVHFSKSELTAEAGMTIRLLRSINGARTPVGRWQAEHTIFGENGGIIANADIGFAGDGYVRLKNDKASIAWHRIEGFGGGQKTIALRYSNGDYTSYSISFTVNKFKQEIVLVPTGSFENYKVIQLEALLEKGKSNFIKLESVKGNASQVNLDELQIY